MERDEWNLWREPNSGKTLLLLKRGFETIRFESPESARSAGCPAHIASQFVTGASLISAREAAQEKEYQIRLAAEAQQKKDAARTRQTLRMNGLEVKQ